MRFLSVTCVTTALLALTGADEQPHIRTYFYVGGSYVDNGDGNHVVQNQMYVEKLVPVDGVKQDAPVVLMHGAAQTGTVSSSLPT